MTTFLASQPALTRPTHGASGNDSSATDATVIVAAIQDTAEAIAAELIAARGIYGDLPSRLGAVLASTASGISVDPASTGENPLPAFDLQEAVEVIWRTIFAEDSLNLTKTQTLIRNALNGTVNSLASAYYPGLAPTAQQIFTVSSGTAVTLNPAYAYGMQILTLTGAAPVITLPTAGAGQAFKLRIVQDATGSRVPSWVVPASGSVKWPGGTAVVPTAAANAVDIYQFDCYVAGQWTGYRDAADVR